MKIAEILKNKPIYVFHAANDSVVSVEHSDGMVESLKKAGNTNVLYTRYDDAPGFPAGGGKGHASYELAFKEEKLPLTTDHHVLFHRPMPLGKATMQTKIIKYGKTVTTIEGKLFDQNERLVATMLHTALPTNIPNQ